MPNERQSTRQFLVNTYSEIIKKEKKNPRLPSKFSLQTAHYYVSAFTTTIQWANGWWNHRESWTWTMKHFVFNVIPASNLRRAAMEWDLLEEALAAFDWKKTKQEQYKPTRVLLKIDIWRLLEFRSRKLYWLINTRDKVYIEFICNCWTFLCIGGYLRREHWNYYAVSVLARNPQFETHVVSRSYGSTIGHSIY